MPLDSLLKKATRLIVRNLMHRAWSRNRLEIGQEQYGFFQHTGTKNAIFMIQVLSELERSISVFHRLHKELLEIVEKLNLYSRYSNSP